MKCIIPEISWNNRDPVLSLDIQPKVDEFTRLATAGSDTHIVIWYLITNDETNEISIEVAADLNKHQKAVNVVRWSPSGEYLAAGDDESNIIIWKLKKEFDNNILQTTQQIESTINNDQHQQATTSVVVDEYIMKETWIIHKILRGHMDDVYDISWSPDSTHLISGSVDNTAIIWNINGTSNNKVKHILEPNHKGFVQGVAWDPLNKYYATLSSDRVCRVFDSKNKKLISKSSKGTLPLTLENYHGETVRLYHDDTLKSFFRRLTFSPDGQLLLAPSGCVELSNESTNKLYLTYIYTRYSFKQPTLILPSPDQFTVVVKCCPILFELRKDGPKSIIGSLPYRMIIAVASQTTITFYDTQQIEPFGTVTNIHYTRITDLSWSSNGRVLAISSTDGFCSLITFKLNELGILYKNDEKQNDNNVVVEKKTLNNINNIDDNDDAANDEWIKKPTNNTINDNDNNIIIESSQDIKLILESNTQDDIIIDDDNNKQIQIQKQSQSQMIIINDNNKTPKAPRRVQFITLSSPKGKKKL